MQGILKIKDEDKLFYKTLVMLCIPIIIQNLISTLVNMVDTVMVGSLGEVSVASIGIANQYFFLFNMALSGIIGGAGIFMAQFYGKGDKDSIKKITGLSVIAALILGLLFIILLFITLLSVILSFPLLFCIFTVSATFDSPYNSIMLLYYATYNTA